MFKNVVYKIIKATTKHFFYNLALYYTTIKINWLASSFSFFDDLGGLFIFYKKNWNLWKNWKFENLTKKLLYNVI